MRTQSNALTRIILGLCIFIYSAFVLAYSPYSNRELEELEKAFIEQINSSNSVIRNPLANQYINHLAKKLAAQGHLNQPYFFIVNSHEINAFAGPGGYIGVNSQLILVTENESELAAVMAHEMAHVRQHHLYRMLEHQQQMRIPMLASMLASLALGVINPGMGSGAMMASLSGFAQDNINFVRSNEKEADRIGIDMLIKSGLNPQGMASFFRKMQQNSRYYYTDNVPAILRSHPLDDDRIAEAENRSSHLPKKAYPDALDYDLFKELIRVSVADNPKQILDFYNTQCQKHPGSTSCQYGYALALLENNQFKSAADHLNLLVQQTPANLNFQISLAQSELGLKQTDSALARLNTLYANYPDNYAAAVALGQGLLASQKAQDAARVLLVARRQFKNDLPLCRELAQAQAASHHKAHAYFTEAQCQLLRGQKQLALRQLTLAKQLAKHDHLLTARIDATVDEVKQK